MKKTSRSIVGIGIAVLALALVGKNFEDAADVGHIIEIAQELRDLLEQVQ